GPTIAQAPVIHYRRPRHPKQPGARPERVTHQIEAADGFEKDLCGQVLGLFSVPHLAIDIAVERAQILLIQPLKFLHGSLPSLLHRGMLPTRECTCSCPWLASEECCNVGGRFGGRPSGEYEEFLSVFLLARM